MASTLTTVPTRPDDDRRQTEGDVLRSLVDGLIAEDLFGFRSRGRIGSVAGALYLPLTGDERHVQVGARRRSGRVPGPPGRRAAALPAEPPARPPARAGRRRARPAHAPASSSSLVAEAPGRGPAGQPRRGPRRAGAGRDPRRRPAGSRGELGRVAAVRPPDTLLDWEALTAVGDRPFHPTGRARVGWDQARYRRYSPAGRPPSASTGWRCAATTSSREAGTGWPRSWRWPPAPAPVARPAGRWLPRRIADPPRPTRCCPSTDRAALESAAASAGVDGPDHVVLPVHPWQHAHVLGDLFAAEWRSGVCVPVAKGLGAFRPTASTRTLVPAMAERPAAPVHVKLPVGISTLGALRLLPPRYLANAARAQLLLEAAADRHPALRGRLHACDEQALVGLRASGAGASALRRQARPSRLPAAGLARRGRRTGPAEPRAARRPRRHASRRARRRVWPVSSPTGATTRPRRTPRWRCSTTSPGSSSEVALACFGLGFMPELHGQNAVLACEAGRVTGIVLRDHDTVRLHRPWLAAAGLPDPGYDVKPGTPNSLWAAGPEELLGWFQTLDPRSGAPGDRPGPRRAPTASTRTRCGAAWPTSSGPPGPASTSRRRRPR